MGRADFLYSGFISKFKYEPTSCQDTLLRKIAEFVSSDDSDILVVNGYAGTGKTTAISAVIETMKGFETKCVLLAPTGRAAKVLSSYSGQPAYTIHKRIYRQKSVGGDGFGQFSLCPNKDKEVLFVVDEVSLIGIDAGQQQSTAAFGTGNLLDDLISYVRAGVDCKLILIGDYVIQSSRKRLLRLIRKSVHNIHVDILKALQTRQQERIFKLFLRVDSSESFEFSRVGALQSKAESVDTCRVICGKLLGIQSAGICLHRNLRVIRDTENRADRLQDPHDLLTRK